jgi:hypothetical protein
MCLLDVYTCRPNGKNIGAAQKWSVKWGVVEDVNLLFGIHKYGMGSWDYIKADPEADVCNALPTSIARSGVPHAVKSGRTLGASCTESKDGIFSQIFRVRYLGTFLYGNGSHSKRVSVTPDRSITVFETYAPVNMPNHFVASELHK